MKCDCCGHDDGEELIEVTPKILECAKAVGKVYKYSAGGGNLHSTIDDGNVDGYEGEDSWYDFEQTGKPTPKAQEKAEKACLRLLNPLSEDERRAALIVWHEYLSKKEDAPQEVDVA